MWKLTIEDDDGKQTGLPLAHEEYALGRAEANSIRLTDRNVSREHAKLCKNGQGWIIRDLNSYNGTYVNGVRIAGEHHLRHGDLVQLGDYRIELVDDSLGTQTPHPSPASGRMAPVSSLHTRPNRLVMVVGPTPGAEFPLEGERLTVGRSEDATISINHSSVSRLHAELIGLGNSRYEVVDKQSANGVRINGVELKRGLLEAGDAIELGDVRLRFVGAGKIFRAGADRLPNTSLGGSYESMAPSARASSSGNAGRGPGRLLGVLFGVSVILGVVVIALTRARNGAGPPASPEAPQTISFQIDGDTRILSEAQERLGSGDLVGAHTKLQELADASQARDSKIFKSIEERWANDMFAQVERAETNADKLALLNVVASTPSVPAALRNKAAEMISQLDTFYPQAGIPRVEPDDQPTTPQPLAPMPRFPRPQPLPPSLPSKSADPPPLLPGSLDASSYEARRKMLEPKVWSGHATTDDIKMLKAICSHMGDSTCRDRANAILQQRQQQ